MLEDKLIAAILPAADLERTKAFYTETLGLPEPKLAAPGTLEFQAGEGSRFILYQHEGGTKADHTVAGWLVEDVEETVERLREKGVVFEQYDMPNLKTDERGIATIGQAQAAWFKDPEGNILSITESPE